LQVQALLKCYSRFSITYERESGIGLSVRIKKDSPGCSYYGGGNEKGVQL